MYDQVVIFKITGQRRKRRSQFHRPPGRQIKSRQVRRLLYFEVSDLPVFEDFKINNRLIFTAKIKIIGGSKPVARDPVNDDSR